MKAKIAFLARVNDGSGRFPFKPVVIHRGRPQAPQGATTFYLRYSENGRRVTESVGSDIDLAYIAFQNRELNHTRVRRGLLPVNSPLSTGTAALGRTPIADTVQSYLSELPAAGKSKGTCRMYADAVEDFQSVCNQLGIIT
jgi:hypothetical protein